MRYILLLLLFIFNQTFAQQKERTVSISCYANSELYIQAAVVAQLSDKSGNVSCKGKYIRIHNTSKNDFYYKTNNRWVVVRPQGKTVILASGADNTSKGPSIVKLGVRYKPDASKSMASKLTAISEMNAHTDKVTSREFESDDSKTQDKNISKTSGATIAKLNQPSAVEPAKAPATTTPSATPTKTEPQKTVTKTATKTNTVAKAKSKTPHKQSRPRSVPVKKQVSNENMASVNAVGLRVDFGKGGAGFGPNIKHKFNRKLSLDAAIVFFERGTVGLGAQVEQNFLVKNAPGLNWYIGIGPQFLSAKDNTTIVLVPVTGLEYTIPKSPLNLSFDWRPNFYLSPETDVEPGRFGLSLRIAF